MVTVSCYRPDGYDPKKATTDNVVGIWKMAAVLDRPWSQTLPSDGKIGVNVAPHGAALAE